MPEPSAREFLAGFWRASQGAAVPQWQSTPSLGERARTPQVFDFTAQGFSGGFLAGVTDASQHVQRELSISAHFWSVLAVTRSYVPRGVSRKNSMKSWCCRTGLNCRPLPYQGRAPVRNTLILNKVFNVARLASQPRHSERSGAYEQCLFRSCCRLRLGFRFVLA